MASRDSAFYDYGLKEIRVRALNADYSQVTVDSIIGGTGTFDFSGETATAVPMYVKIDSTEYSFDVDISAASDTSAVTAAEVVTALTTAFTTESVALTAEVDSTSGRVVLSATGTPDDVQVYGSMAELIEIGQGFGTQYIYSDTIVNLDTSPMRKDSEDKTVTNANGFDETIKTEGYYKSEDGTIVDTATDWYMKSFFEGTKVADDGSISSAVSSTVRPFFTVEAFYGKYKKGESYESDYVGVRYEKYYKCKGLTGDKSRSADIANSNYTFNAQTYTDSDNTEHSAWTYKDLTVEEYEAMNVKEVSA